MATVYYDRDAEGGIRHDDASIADQCHRVCRLSRH